MAHQLFGYSSSYGVAAPSSTAATSIYASRSFTGQYLSDSTLSRYLGTGSVTLSSDPSKDLVTSSMYLSQSEALRYSADRGTSSSPHLPSWPPPPGVDVPAADDPIVSGVKRHSEVLYPRTVLGAHNTIGQSEGWYSTNSLVKRSRYESASIFSIYPQRPGEKDCAYYMRTRTCIFGDSCKFDHPVWVPEGGIPDWKEVSLASTNESLPERPGEPDCPYFLKTQRCKYGSRCKFNHPKDQLDLGDSENTDISVLPERPSEPPCAFYMKSGNCKFGAMCKFHHPRDIQLPLIGHENIKQTESAFKIEGTTGNVNVVKASVSSTPALFHNSKGLPIRLGEVDCPFYLKTGSCKYGATCRYNHPDWNAINPSTAAALRHPILGTSAANLNMGVVNPVASMYQTIDPRLAHSTLGAGPTVYPQRPGQTECDYYMKTGDCKFGERCKFHHPIDRSAPTAKQVQQQTIKLTLAGLPRREGSIHCPYYMKTGACKFGATCKFDHPPPGEVMAITASQEMPTSVGVSTNLCP